MASFRFELGKNIKTIDEKEMSGIDGYKAIHYACNWLSNKPPSNAQTTYSVFIAKRAKDGLYHYYCTVYRPSNGQYRKMKGNYNYLINPETGRTITERKKTVKRK